MRADLRLTAKTHPSFSRMSEAWTKCFTCIQGALWCWCCQCSQWFLVCCVDLVSSQCRILETGARTSCATYIKAGCSFFNTAKAPTYSTFPAILYDPLNRWVYAEWQIKFASIRFWGYPTNWGYLTSFKCKFESTCSAWRAHACIGHRATMWFAPIKERHANVLHSHACIPPTESAGCYINWGWMPISNTSQYRH